MGQGSNGQGEFKTAQLPIELEALPALKTRPSILSNRIMDHSNALSGLTGPLLSPGVADIAFMFPDSSMIGTAAASNDPFHHLFERGDGLMAPSPAHLTMPLSALATSRGATAAADFGASFQETLMQQSGAEPELQRPSQDQVDLARRFIQSMDELEKRAHILWEAENYELERGAMLRVLGGLGSKPPLAPKPYSNHSGNPSSIQNAMPPPPPQMPRPMAATPTAPGMLQPMSATATDGLVGAASPSQSDLLGFISLHGINNSPSSLGFDLVHAEVRLLGAAQGTPTKASRSDAMEIDGICRQ